MAAFFIAPVYILLNIYIVWRLLGWLRLYRNRPHGSLFKIITITIYFIMSFSILIGFILPHIELKRFFEKLGFLWLKVMFFTIIVLALFEISRIVYNILLKKNKVTRFTSEGIRRAGNICISLIILLCLISSISARIIFTTEYDISVNKTCGTMKSMKIAMVADMHLGYNIGCGTMERMVDKINATEPDLVIIAGDIFDNKYSALDDPEKLCEILRGIKSRYGVYACYGNHDIEEKILAGFTFNSDEATIASREMSDFLKASNIRLLHDEGVLIDDSFYLYGRPDYYKSMSTGRKTPEEIVSGMNKSKPILIIDHQPKELLALSRAGVDIDFGGHTHGGQVFPVTLMINKFSKPKEDGTGGFFGHGDDNGYGCTKVGDMYSIVTSGVGIFGPYMRLGSKSEICSINVDFSRR